MFRKIFLVVLGIAIVIVAVNIVAVWRSQRALNDVNSEYSFGPGGADLHVVEFLDYSCEYCHEAHPTITEAMMLDGRIIYSPRAVDFLGSKSTHAAKALYAAARQGKLEEVHNALMEDFDGFVEQGFKFFSTIPDLDLDQLQTDMRDEEIAALIEDNMKLFNRVGTGSTPTFVLGGKIVYTPKDRMPTVQDFLNMFAEAREARGVKE